MKKTYNKKQEGRLTDLHCSLSNQLHKLTNEEVQTVLVTTLLHSLDKLGTQEVIRQALDCARIKDSSLDDRMNAYETQILVLARGDSNEA